MLYTIPDHDAQLLRGAPLDDGPDPIEIEYKRPVNVLTPVVRNTPDGTEWDKARGLIIEHLACHLDEGWDADTVRRAVQVDLDEDLEPEDFGALADLWQEGGLFDTEEELDAFNAQLDDVLRFAEFSKGARR